MPSRYEQAVRFLNRTWAVAALWALLGACHDLPVGPTGVPNPDSVTEALSNEPSGYSPVVEFDGSQMPPRGFSQTNEGLLALDPGPGATTGDNSGWDSPPHELVTDASAPVDDRVLRVHFPAGATSSPGYFNLWGPSKDVLDNLGISEDRPDGFELEEMYVSYHFRMTSGPADGRWEMGTHLKLMGYFGFGEPSPGSGQAFFRTPGFSSPQLIESTELWLEQQGPSSVSIENKLKWTDRFGPINVDQWHHLELVAELNDIGQKNGTLRLYLDGELKYTNDAVMWRSAEHPKGFTVIHVGQVWGNGVQTRSRTDYVDIDNIYVSGTELTGVND